MDRKTWDRIISAAGAVVAVVLIVLGAMAIYGGQFGRDSVRDRLVPEKVTFPPYDAMTPQEQAAVGTFAGQQVDTGPEAEAFSRYIAGHLAEVNEGKTYSETSAAARQEGLDPNTAAELQAKADVLFKGETLRSILLNAYGWWTVATLALWAGIAMVLAGVLLGIFSILGFRHAARVDPVMVVRKEETAQTTMV
jgi:ABC-type antimicrobial peptide transport system permease subunit